MHFFLKHVVLLVGRYYGGRFGGLSMGVLFEHGVGSNWIAFVEL